MAKKQNRKHRAEVTSAVISAVIWKHTMTFSPVGQHRRGTNQHASKAGIRGVIGT